MAGRKKKPAKRVLSEIFGAAWAMRESAIREMLTVAGRAGQGPEALAALYGRPLDNTHDVTVRDGVATIPIRGKMFRYANMLTEVSGCTSYECLATDFETCLADPNVSAILLDIDSPGGEVNGCMDLATLFASARGVKPIVAHISGDGCSAAYVLASAADEIVVSSMAVVGCLGVVFEIEDSTSADEALGLKTYRIVSSQTPNKDIDPATPDGQAQVRRVADAFATRMLADVAGYRGTTAEALIEASNRGDVLVGEAAVAAGLADRVATYEDLHALLTARPPRAGSTTLPTPENRMSPEALKKDHQETAQALLTEGATAERTRLAAIGQLPAVGAEEIRAACLNDPSCSVDAAARKILEAQAAKTKTAGAARIDALKGDETQLAAPKPDAAADGDRAGTDADVTRILATHRGLGGRSALPAPTTRRTA